MTNIAKHPKSHLLKLIDGRGLSEKLGRIPQQKKSKSVRITNVGTGESQIFPSLYSAGKFIKRGAAMIYYYAHPERLFKGKWKIEILD